MKNRGVFGQGGVKEKGDRFGEVGTSCGFDKTLGFKGECNRRAAHSPDY